MIIKLEDLIEKFDLHHDLVPNEARDFFRNIDTSYTLPTVDDLQEYVSSVLKKIDSPHVLRNKQENLEAFERGWQENLEQLTKQGPTRESLKPKYFKPTKYLRYDGRLIVANNSNIEYDLFTLARYFIFSKYLTGFQQICEIGCGSCQNLLMIAELFRNGSIVGLDWTQSSTEIASLLSRVTGRDISGYRFDMLAPHLPVSPISPGAAIITIHSMEQLGSNFSAFLDYLIKIEPGLVIHYEPIYELYKEDNFYDYLAMLYSRKRNYLAGYLPKLYELEKRGSIEILEVNRPYIGGIIHESSLVVWKIKRSSH